MRFENGLVAGADLVRKTQLLVAAAAQKREGQRAALATDRDRSRLACRRGKTPARVVKHRAEGRDERLLRVDNTLGIGAADDDAVTLGDARELNVASTSGLVALFGKAGADHNCGTDSTLAALLDGVNDVRSGHKNYREIDRLGECSRRRVGFDAEDFALAAGYRVEAAVITMLDQRASQPSAQRLVIAGRADDRDAVG